MSNEFSWNVGKHAGPIQPRWGQPQEPLIQKPLLSTKHSMIRLRVDKFSLCTQCDIQEYEVTDKLYHRILLGQLPEGYDPVGKFLDTILNETKLTAYAMTLQLTQTMWNNEPDNLKGIWTKKDQMIHGFPVEWIGKQTLWYGDTITEGFHFVILPDENSLVK